MDPLEKETTSEHHHFWNFVIGFPPKVWQQYPPIQPSKADLYHPANEPAGLKPTVKLQMLTEHHTNIPFNASKHPTFFADFAKHKLARVSCVINSYQFHKSHIQPQSISNHQTSQPPTWHRSCWLSQPTTVPNFPLSSGRCCNLEIRTQEPKGKPALGMKTQQRLGAPWEGFVCF